MADEQKCLAAVLHLLDAFVTPDTEAGIPDRQRLIDDDDVSVDVDRASEAKAGHHARRVRSKRHVEIIIKIGKRGYGAHARGGFRAAQTHQAAEELGIFTTGELWIKAGTYREKNSDTPIARDGTGRWLDNFAENAEKRRLASAVSAHNA